MNMRIIGVAQLLNIHMFKAVLVTVVVVAKICSFMVEAHHLLKRSYYLFLLKSRANYLFRFGIRIAIMLVMAMLKLVI